MCQYRLVCTRESIRDEIENLFAGPHQVHLLNLWLCMMRADEQSVYKGDCTFFSPGTRQCVYTDGAVCTHEWVESTKGALPMVGWHSRHIG